MLVYGDRERTADPRAALGEVERLARAGDRRLALIEAAMLAQGLADAEFAALGCDDLTPVQAAAMGLAQAAAGNLVGRPADLKTAAARLAGLRLPATVRLRTPEGFAFYAVYPEAYAAGARAHDWSGPLLAIGLRSIGLALAAVVAAAAGGEALSLRPAGPPYRREVRVSDRLRGRLLSHEGTFAIVDEGPGRSGSSFGATADLLEGLGVRPDRIVFMPSHRGDLGPEASAAHRARWRRARRLVRTLGDMLAERPMGTWFEDLVGPAREVRDISAGAWREGAWPPAAPAQERRKFRLRTPSGDYVARFAGLDRSGDEKLARAEALHRAGFAPEPLALRDGFLLERWVEGVPLAADPQDRAGLLRHLAAYLRFRADRFPAAAEAGAGLDLLGEMAAANIERLCGAEVAARLVPRIEALAAVDLRPVHMDGRLHRWEWRRTRAGLRKLDALDHSCAHDLAGAQDIAWDVAGAAVEFDLPAAEAAELARACGRDPATVAGFEALYLAHQGGLWTMAESAGGPDEAARIRPLVAGYSARLQRLAGAG